MNQLEVVETDLALVKKYIDNHQFDMAGPILNAYMTDHPNDEKAQFLYGRMQLETEAPGPARVTFESLTKKDPSNATFWHSLGTSYEFLVMPAKAEECFKKALEREPENIQFMTSLATNYVQQHKSELAIEWCKKALHLNHNNGKAHSTLGFAYLQLRDFDNGWKEYEHGLGKLRWRDERVYGKEPRWEGEKDKGILVYGEQGLGDMIAGCEPLNDASEVANILAMETHPKLAKLLQRSFPGIPVHGTVFKKGVDWSVKSEIEGRVSTFSLHKLFRKSEKDYTGKPFLIACPQRRIQARALLDSLGEGLKIGIAWSGGIALTQSKARKAELDKWLPIFGIPGCHFIDLEYKDRSREIAAFEKKRKVKIHHFPWITQTPDYDDTAALVAELDLIVTVPTAAVHLAGGLGVETLCMVHSKPAIHYSRDGDKMAYYDSVRTLRRKKDTEWTITVKQVAKLIKEKLNGDKQLHEPERSDSQLAS